MTSILARFNREVELEDLSVEDLKEVQSLLNRAGYRLNVDGFLGPKTTAAFNNFKQENFLAVPGVLGPTTVKALIEAIPIPKTKEDHVKLILVECSKQGLYLDTQQAYVLATTQHETANTYRPISEYGGPRMRYAPYYGRGYTQLTWYDNYLKYEKILGKPLTKFPELAKEPFTAAFIMVHGFRTGNFTGKKITQYIAEDYCDFVGCRRCINAMDRAQHIANLAQIWLPKVKAIA